MLERLAAFEPAAGPTRVINATGVIVHTNLGRAPWPRAAIAAAGAAAAGTLFLELDRGTGPARPPVTARPRSTSSR